MSFILARPLYHDKDKSKVVEEGDPQSAFVIGGAGSSFSEEEAKAMGLDDSHRLKEEVAVDEPVADDTADAPVEEEAATDETEEAEDAAEEEEDTGGVKPVKKAAAKKPAAKAPARKK